MTRTSIDWLLQRPVNHVGYVVPDIPTAADDWAKVGVGPFWVFKDIVFDEVTHQGRPAVFDHSAAFAKWGDGSLELHGITEAKPQALADGVRFGTGNNFNHVSYLSDEPDEDSERLAAAGCPEILTLRLGDHVDYLHWAPFLGHAIEIHKNSPVVTDLWKMVEAESKGWDGTDPVRIMAPPGPS
jgi:hypothetical protein